MTTDISAEFVAGERGQLLVVMQHPESMPGASGGVLLVPPFAEEMNKSRKLLTEFANGIAQHGLIAIIPDLYGTGDSDGEFGDADWQTWISDVVSVLGFMQRRRISLSGVLAVRLGCALAIEALTAASVSAPKSLLWQPLAQGKSAIDYYLRLRTAASLMEDDQRESAADLRSMLAAGERVETAGYEISPQLEQSLDALNLVDLDAGCLGHTAWFELRRTAGGQLSPISRRIVEQWRGEGLSITANALQGEPFWTSTELVANDRLVDESVRYFAASA